MTKLTQIQEKVLDKMQDGKWYCSYELRCSLSTMNALTKKGYLMSKDGLGSMRSPRTGIYFRLKQKEQNETCTS